MNIKVLPLEYWMTVPWLRDDCLAGGRYHAAPQRYNRSGIFRVGKSCWFELGDGRAYTYPVGSFDYTLGLRAAECLNVRQVRALESVVQQKLATRGQRSLLQLYRDAMDIRATARQTRKEMIKLRVSSE